MYIYIVNHFSDVNEYNGLIVVIAKDNGECFKLISEKFNYYFDKKIVSEEEYEKNVEKLSMNIIYSKIYKLEQEHSLNKGIESKIVDYHLI